MKGNQKLNIDGRLRQAGGLLIAGDQKTDETTYRIIGYGSDLSGTYRKAGCTQFEASGKIRKVQATNMVLTTRNMGQTVIFRRFCVATLLMLFFITGCKDDVLPKPKAELRLEYSAPEMVALETDEFVFEYNKLAKVKKKNPNSLVLEYPEMKGEIFINYRKVDNNIEKLLSDAQKLSYEHSVKADGILEQPFVNEENQVYGMFYEVSGNAASQAQFYVTDSTEHFLTGSLYFMSRPNYDSIYPAAAYLQNDIRGIMETLRWKDE